ncbi:MAG: hypothetical protein J5695_07980 [Bacteroidales bacterium]|nr:hypothetical protein [Bacteroidales bacterium]
MKQYTDQGKVDTRSGCGKGRRVAKALLACGVFFFVLMPIVSSCFKWHRDNTFVLEYQVNDGGPNVVEFPCDEQYGLAPKWFDSSLWPIFSYSPPPPEGADYLPPSSDSLARFYFSLSYDFHPGAGVSFCLRSDTSFFCYGEIYYMSSCDSLVIYNDDESIRKLEPCSLDLIWFPEFRSGYLLRDKSWVRFHSSEDSSIWFTLEFEYVMLKSEDDDSVPTNIKGFLDLYKKENYPYKQYKKSFDQPLLRKR